MSNKQAIEAKLVAAVEKTAALVQGGQAPSQAIAKAAMDVGVPAGHINALVHAYNTGQTNRQRLDGDTLLEKTADFELADAEQVLEHMYPTQVKAASATKQSTAISTEYALPPTGVLARREAMTKRAANVNWRTMADATITAPEPYPGDPKERVKKATSQVDRLQRGADELRRAASEAFDKMGHTFCELTEYFRRPGCTPIPIVKENAMILHGAKAEQIIDQLVQVTPGLAKMAHNQPVMRSHRDLAATGRPYQLIEELVGEIQTYKEAKARYLSTAADAEKQAGVLLRPFAEASPSVSVLEGWPSSTEKLAWGWSDANAGGLNLVGRQLGNLAHGFTDPRDPAADDYAALTDPQHEQELRDVKTEAMLQYLMTNDDDIAGYEPDEVLNSYNEIVDAVPRAADQMLLMRTLLKKKLKGQLDTHEIDQALGMGEKLRSRDERSQSELTERGQSQEAQQFRERQQAEAERFEHEKAKFKTEMEHRKKELQQKEEEFRQRKLEAQGIAERGRRGFLGLGRKPDTLTEQARANVMSERQKGTEFRHRQGIDLAQIGMTADQIAEARRHNRTGEGMQAYGLGQTNRQLTEAERHNLKAEGYTDQQIREMERHNRTGEEMQEAGLTGQYKGDRTMAERHHTDQTDAQVAALEQGAAIATGNVPGYGETVQSKQLAQQKAQHDAQLAQQAAIAQGSVLGGPTLQSQQFTYQKGRDTRSDTLDQQRAERARADLDEHNLNTELAHDVEQDALAAKDPTYVKKPFVPKAPAMAAPAPVESVLP